MTRPLNPVLRKTIVFDRAGKHLFQPVDYPWLVYVLASVRPAERNKDGCVVLELWGWDEEASVHRVQD